MTTIERELLEEIEVGGQPDMNQIKTGDRLIGRGFVTYHHGERQPYKITREGREALKA